MKLLHLSVVTQVINEEGEELLERASGKKEKEVGGLTKVWFEEQGLKVPEELQEDDIERDEDGAVYLDEKHLNYEAMSVTVPLKNICSYVEGQELGTMIYMKSGLFYHVYETVEEVDDYIEYLTTSDLKAFYISVKLFFRRIKWKVNLYFARKKESEVNIKTE